MAYFKLTEGGRPGRWLAGWLARGVFLLGSTTVGDARVAAPEGRARSTP